VNPELRLVSREGDEYVARFVYRGDPYGLGGRLFNNDNKTLVEFSRPRLGGDRYVAVLPAEELTDIGELWSPKGVQGLTLPARQADRLRRWVVSPSSVDDSVVVLVGLDDVVDKAQVALSRLLEPRHETDGEAAIDRIRRLPPQLVVVGQEIRGLEPLELVRRIHVAPESRDVPIVVIGGDATAADQAGAVLHVPSPPDYAALVSRASELLELL
jgi:CheY-like chemotaxis protein